MNQEFWSVTELTKTIKEKFDTAPDLQNVWLRAEISNFKHHSRGHMYFTLKDAGSRIQSVMFAGSNRYLKFTPENGMSVLIRGQVSVYEPYGQYQLYVKEMQPDGIGNLYLAYEELKEKLDREGLFSQESKKRIPRTPKRIAVVTSPTGAAVRDMITTLNRRYPVAGVTLLPVQVQGEYAAPSIVKAIRQAEEEGSFDVLIVGRGGGSLEELWAFNEEAVARAIFSCTIPVISAVGHETDITISDFVADLRAATPTAAAELAVPDQQEMIDWLIDRKKRLRHSFHQMMTREQTRLQRLTASYAFRYPKQLIEQKEQDLDRLLDRFHAAAERKIDVHQEAIRHLYGRLYVQHPARRIDQERINLERLEKALVDAMTDHSKSEKQALQLLASKLDLLSPLKLMAKGYSLTYDQNGNLVKEIDQLNEGDGFTVHLRDGELNGEVKGKKRVKRIEEESE